MYLNKAIVYGNLTRDPEMKALPSGQNVTSMSIATNRTWNDKDGKKQEETEYHNVTVFGKTAENCAKYLTKGSGVYVEGRLQTRSWEKDGAKQYRTEIVAETVQFGTKREGSSQATQAPVMSQNEPALPDYPEEEINPEDIPF
jgi:single-strand DNA-binding protein